MDTWIAFWLADFSEPPSNPVYLALFAVFLILGTAAIYTFRGIPHWIIDSPRTRVLRSSAAVGALLSIVGASILVLQAMSVPVVSRRIWLAVIVILLGVHFVLFALVARRSVPRTIQSDEQSLAGLELLQ
jgi:hypothetical protein